MGNYTVGAPVTFLHNWSDVAISWTRMWGETKYYKTLALYSFILSQFVWIYTRLYVFSQIIVSFLSIEVFTVNAYI